MRTKYILFFLFLFSLNFVLASTCPTGVYPCDESVQFNNPTTTTSSSTDYSILNVNNSIYWQGHTGTDGSWLTGISGSGNPFNQSLNTTDSVRFNSLNITMGATQRQAITVDGETNDYTENYTGNSIYVNDFLRAYNVGTKRPENMAVVKSTLNIRHTNADVSNVSPYYYAMTFQINDVGNHINPGTVTKTVNEYGIQGSVLPSGILNTNNSGGIIFQQFGMSGLVSDSRKLNKSGGTNAMSYLYSYGTYNQVTSNPIVYGGNWTVNNYGEYISVTGNRNGTSANYGLYIQTVTGADSNYGIYDASGTLWIKTSGNTYLRGDNSKIIQGTGDDTSIYYNGTDMIINPKEVGVGKLFIRGKLVINETIDNNVNFTGDLFSHDQAFYFNTTNNITKVQYLNATNTINTITNFSVNNFQGLTFNYTTVCDVDLVGLTKKYQNFTVKGGIIISNTTCV